MPPRVAATKWSTGEANGPHSPFFHFLQQVHNEPWDREERKLTLPSVGFCHWIEARLALSAVMVRFFPKRSYNLFSRCYMAGENESEN